MLSRAYYETFSLRLSRQHYEKGHHKGHFKCYEKVILLARVFVVDKIKLIFQLTAPPIAQLTSTNTLIPLS